MNHSVTVSAEKSHIRHLGSHTRAQMRDRHRMMALDITIPNLPVPFLEVEPADPTDETTVLPNRKALGAFHQSAVSLPRSVRTKQDLALGELVLLVLRRRNRLLGWPVIYASPDRLCGL